MDRIAQALMARPNLRFPDLVAQNPYGYGAAPELRNLPERPSDPVAQPIAEALSPTMGAYGMGQAAGSVANSLRTGDYQEAAKVGLPLMLGMFAGPGARTADLGMLAKAQEMAAKGTERGPIWSDTGWFRGPDSRWRFEIPDSGTEFNKAAMLPKEYNILGNSITALTGDAKSALPHPPVYDAYPQLANLDVVQGRSSGDFKGQFSGEFGGAISPSIALDFDQLHDPGDMRSTFLHELQHGVQSAEDFARGGNQKYGPKDVPNPASAAYERALKDDPRMQEYQSLRNSPQYEAELADSNARWNEVYKPQMDALDKLRTALPREAFKTDIYPKEQAIFDAASAESRQRHPTMTRMDELFSQLRDSGIPTQRPNEFLDPFEVYRRLAGEVEARNVQKRMDMTPEQRRATPPWETQDVPDEQQIVRFK